MTVQHLNQMVQAGADARFDEVIERLLFILEYPPFLSEPKTLVWKWKQTGLLDGLEDYVAEILAKRLEDAARQIVDWCALENPDDDAIEKAVERFSSLRDAAVKEYECQRNYHPHQEWR